VPLIWKALSNAWELNRKRGKLSGTDKGKAESQRSSRRARDQSHTMSIARSSVHAKWVVGKVIGTAMQKTAKVRVTRLVLDPYLLKYFNKRKTYFAHDALQQCTVGDIVLLKALPVPKTKHVKHELAEIIFKVGQVIDPVTGKRCAGTTYLESPVSLETTHLSKNLEKLDLSSTQ
ncbi:hypothetical protein DBR06_SOUSAS610127, partial [Sousa chinensis]